MSVKHSNGRMEQENKWMEETKNKESRRKKLKPVESGCVEMSARVCGWLKTLSRHSLDSAVRLQSEDRRLGRNAKSLHVRSQKLDENRPSFKF